MNETYALRGAASRELESRIIGGSKASPKRFPYFTKLTMSYRYSLSTTKRRCGGTLIAPDVILTAAHCLVPSSALESLYSIQAWVNSSSTSSSSYDYYRAASRYAIHPNYATVNADLALLFLDRPVTGVTPIKFNKAASIPVTDQSLTAIGVGLIKRPPEVAATNLMQVSVKTVSHGVCRNSYGVGESKLQICAGGTKNICQGDSGGPLMRRGSTARQDLQVGISSFGSFAGCGIGTPSVFTKVSYYATWIETTVCSYSKKKPSWCP